MSVENWPFKAKAFDIKVWFNNKGHAGNCYEAAGKYFQAKVGAATNSLYDNMRKHLFSLGYVGSLGDQLNKFFTTKNGSGGRAAPDAERAFWKNLGGDFS